MEEIFKLKKYPIDQSLPMSSLYDKVLLRESGIATPIIHNINYERTQV